MLMLLVRFFPPNPQLRPADRPRARARSGRRVADRSETSGLGSRCWEGRRLCRRGSGSWFGILLPGLLNGLHMQVKFLHNDVFGTHDWRTLALHEFPFLHSPLVQDPFPDRLVPPAGIRPGSGPFMATRLCIRLDGRPLPTLALAVAVLAAPGVRTFPKAGRLLIGHGHANGPHRGPVRERARLTQWRIDVGEGVNSASCGRQEGLVRRGRVVHTGRRRGYGRGQYAIHGGRYAVRGGECRSVSFTC